MAIPGGAAGAGFSENQLKGEGAQHPGGELEEPQGFPSFRHCFCWFALAGTVTGEETVSFVRDALGLWGEP